MLRIVGGRFRGRKLAVPARGEVRPTTDRVRESLFNVLDHRFGRPCEGARVLDLFAGSGALGLEAGSRGAATVDLVEGDPAVARTTAQNAAAFAATLHVQPVSAFLDGPARPFDLVFLDPPYAGGHVTPTLAKLAQAGWLADDAVVCVEHGATAPFSTPVGWRVDFTRRYGATTVTILGREEP